MDAIRKKAKRIKSGSCIINRQNFIVFRLPISIGISISPITEDVFDFFTLLSSVNRHFRLLIILIDAVHVRTTCSNDISNIQYSYVSS